MTNITKTCLGLTYIMDKLCPERCFFQWCARQTIKPTNAEIMRLPKGARRPAKLVRSALYYAIKMPAYYLTTTRSQGCRMSKKPCTIFSYTCPMKMDKAFFLQTNLKNIYSLVF